MVVEVATELAALDTLYDAMEDSHSAWAAQAAIGLPACNGVTIVQSLVHHYVDPHKQVCDAVLEQVWPTPLTPPPNATVDELKDVLCHKLSHPILSTMLVWLARHDGVKKHLSKIGLGAAVVRLPAEFGPEKTASAFKALVYRAAASAKNANVAVSTEPVDKLVAAVLKAIQANPNQEGMAAGQELIEEFKTEWGYGIAWLAGFLNAQFDDMKASQIARSVTAAYSVSSLHDNITEASGEGRDHFDLAKKWRRSQAKAGKLAGHGFMGADVPTPFGDPETESGE
jgi:hypothetical protein